MTDNEDRRFDSKFAAVTIGEADVQRAQGLATTAHHGQLDKAGRPYIGHPTRVVGYLVNPTVEESVVRLAARCSRGHRRNPERHRG